MLITEKKFRKTLVQMHILNWNVLKIRQKQELSVTWPTLTHQATKKMLSGVQRSESLFAHMYLKFSLTRARHGTSELKPSAQVSIVPAVIPLKRIFKIVQGVEHFLLSLHFPTVNIDIPPIFVPVVIKRNGEHYSQCSVDVGNVVRHDSHGSCRHRSCGFTCSVQ